jgi:hypothetical protein
LKKTFSPGSEPRKRLQEAISKMQKEVAQVPCVINGKEVINIIKIQQNLLSFAD